MDFNRNNKKYKFGTETSMIKYIGTKNVIKEKEINKINHKRVIQMLDLFNSKYNCKKCCKKLRYKADQIIHCKLKHSPLFEQGVGVVVELHGLQFGFGLGSMDKGMSQ